MPLLRKKEPGFELSDYYKSVNELENNMTKLPKIESNRSPVD